MLRGPRTSHSPWSGSPVRDRGLDLATSIGHRARPAGPGSGRAGRRVEQDPTRRAGADPRRRCRCDRRAVIPGQVIERLLGQFPLAADPVHDLQVRVLLGEVGEEIKEVIRLPVKAQRVQPPEHEGRIAQPGVAVVIIAFSARRLRQRRGRRRQQGAGGRVDQPLERQRRPLQVLAPRVIGEIAAGEPLVPEIRRAPQPLVSVVEGLRRGPVLPGQRAENPLPGPQPAPRDRPRALETQVQVGGQPQQRALLARADLGLPVTASPVAASCRAGGRSRTRARIPARSQRTPAGSGPSAAALARRCDRPAPGGECRIGPNRDATAPPAGHHGSPPSRRGCPTSSPAPSSLAGSAVPTGP